MADTVAVLADPVTAAIALGPVRARLLAALAAEPASAATVAARLDLPRQRVGHHPKALADRGLVEEVEQRRHGGLIERVFAPSASSYVVSASALGGVGVDPRRVRDRLSAAYLVALAARAIDEMGELLRGAANAGKNLPTMSVDADARFASAADRNAFADELAGAVRALAARYHDESAANGRWYRVVAFSHPLRQAPNKEHAS